MNNKNNANKYNKNLKNKQTVFVTMLFYKPARVTF